ncbi:hypothetical protein ACIQZG_24305 [Lysinibacillus sp. NPDC096418]
MKLSLKDVLTIKPIVYDRVSSVKLIEKFIEKCTITATKSKDSF